MSDPVFQLIRPEQVLSSVVFASPHSGRVYPADFVRDSVLDAVSIRSSEDAFVDQLFEGAPIFGAPLLSALMPRAFVDLNRSPDEIDPALVSGAKRLSQNPRVASGLGVIPRVVANGRAIYSGKLPMEVAQNRLNDVWHPYHNALQRLLNNAHRLFGQAILVDCHSMPHEAMDGVARNGGKCPEIVLGDRFGAAANANVVDRIESTFASAGFAVARNAPFAGAYVTQAYGRPSRSQHAVQVEIDRSIYMDEKRITPNENFDAIRKLLRKVTAEIVSIGYDKMPVAAE